jgi:PAS domain S-box-containing protein
MHIFGDALPQKVAVLPDRNGTARGLRTGGGAPFFQQIVECARCSLLVIEALSHDQMIVYASPGIEELTGYSPEDFVGQDWRQLLSRSEARSPADPETTRPGAVVHESFTIRHKDGRELCLDVKLSRLGAEPAFITHYIAVLNHLTPGVPAVLGHIATENANHF